MPPTRLARRFLAAAAVAACFAVVPALAQEEDPGPDSPECQWAGERILSLLWRDDIRTATDFLNLYDRFACPPDQVAVAFRCLVKVGVSPDQGDPGLPQRAQACWANPALDPASLMPAAAAPGGEQQPAAEGEQPAQPEQGRDVAPQGGDKPAAPEAQKPAQ